MKSVKVPALELFLHEMIPLAKAMGVGVEVSDDRVLVLTQRPGSIKLDMDVNLPRPRVEEMRYTPEFGEMAKKLKDAIE